MHPAADQIKANAYAIFRKKSASSQTHLYIPKKQIFIIFYFPSRITFQEAFFRTLVI